LAGARGGRGRARARRGLERRHGQGGGAAAVAAAEEEEESESEAEAILRVQRAARATAAEVPPGFDGYEGAAEEPFEDSDDEEPDDGETIVGEREVVREVVEEEEAV
jgi:hypothetical protein